ncbi:MAG: hypothetical protein CTY27_00290 [Methylotenera sp.]|nr:MAG: hypothetical protein CTY27_00290 [Methylotenera sp.]
MSEQNKLLPKLRFPEFKSNQKWEVIPLSSVSDVRDGTHDSPKFYDAGRPLLTSKNLLKDGSLDTVNVSFISDSDFEQINKRSKVDIGDILFGMIGTIGNPVMVKTDGFAIKNIALIKQKSDLLNSYLVQLLNSEYITKEFSILNTGNSQKFIALGQIRSLKIPAPSLLEQQKVADCLSSLDDLITAQNQKVEALKQHKKGLMQQLFPAEGETVPKLRFPEFKNDGEWSPKILGTFIDERSSLANHDLPLYSLTIENGVTPKSERYERAFLVKDEADAYKVVEPNDFAFNPMNLRFGAIARHAGDQKVALSKYYNIFYCNSTVDSRFCEAYFKSEYMVSVYDDIATGSLIEKRRVHFSKFLKLNLKFPELKEQQKIADLLTSTDNLITAQTQQLKAYKTHKKGLMQQLFPSLQEVA